MKIIDSQIHYDMGFDKYFNDMKVCFLDIETTGLSRTYNSIYLIGILFYDYGASSWILRQILAETIEEESEVLKEAYNLISKFNKIITYNGDSFDIPFINSRIELYNNKDQIYSDNSLDLYRIVRENKMFLNLENMKLKTIEKLIGINREDIYTGKDCIGFYQEYMITKDTELERKILKHNYDDLYYLPFILRIRDIIDDIKTIIILEDINLYINTISLAGDTLIIQGLISENLPTNIIYYNNNYKIITNDNLVEIGIDYEKGLVSPTEKALFVRKNELALPDSILDSTNYNLPDNILLLQVEKKYCIDNIKSIVQSLMLSSLSESY